MTRAGYPDTTKTVDVARGATLREAVALVGGSLELASTPPGAEVWLDGKRIGVTPHKVTETPPGRYAFQLTLKGYKETAKTLTVGGRQPARETVVLEKIRGAEEGQTWTIPDLGLVLVPIVAGSFVMGSPAGEADRGSDEGPQTRVTISKPFWLGKTEVTQKEWTAVMGSNPSSFKGENLPVENVSWEDAMAFCRKLTERERAADRLPAGLAYTLPTEAQWEYACRAGTSSAFHYGDRLDASMANLDGNYPYGGASKGEYRQKTTNVGSFRPNAWGLFDMHGNVREWCADWYADKLPGGAVSDPAGAPSGSNRVYRGGSWFNFGPYCRSASRYGDTPGYRNYNLGFRLALSSVRGGP